MHELSLGELAVFFGHFAGGREGSGKEATASKAVFFSPDSCVVFILFFCRPGLRSGEPG